MEKKKKLDEWEFLELGNVIRGKSKGVNRCRKIMKILQQVDEGKRKLLKNYGCENN